MVDAIALVSDRIKEVKDQDKYSELMELVIRWSTTQEKTLGDETQNRFLDLMTLTIQDVSS